LLFLPTGWFALAAGNQRVPGVVVPSLAAGLALVGHGDVASLVGRLRPGFRVVDVDVEGLRGQAIADEIAEWCRARGGWCVRRPSGGAIGRSHVFVQVGEDLAGLDAVVGSLRAAYGVGRSRVDVRVMVRPLSAPHRTGVETKPVGSVAATLKDLVERLRTSVADSRPAVRPRRPSPREALVPRPRRRRELPPQWQLFLETGLRPVLGQDDPDRAGGDYSRSTFEAIATACMVRAGWSVQEAWAAIEAAHPQAMDHARGDRVRWVRHVWNRAVEDDTARPVVDSGPDAQVWAAVEAARARLQTLAWSYPLRQRASLLRVGLAVLDRMTRHNSTRVPVPERDLILDTGIRDRTTIRTALRRLHGSVGVLDTSTFDPHRARDRSSFEFEIPLAPVQWGGVPQIPPPSCHTPLPRTPLHLGSTAWLLLHALTRDAGRVWTVTDLMAECQLTERAGEVVVGKRLRTVREALGQLAAAGLARCTVDGSWAAVAVAAHDPRGRDESWDEVVAQISTERAQYRAGGGSRWDVARAAAIKKNRARQRAWWAGLEPVERDARETAWSTRFAGLSVTDQQRVKTELAERTVREGVSPAVRHQRWIYAMDPEDLAFVASERALRFARLPHPYQVALVRAWEAHRHRFGIPRGSWQIGAGSSVDGESAHGERLSTRAAALSLEKGTPHIGDQGG